MRKKTVGWVFLSSAILIAVAIFGSARLVYAESATMENRLATFPTQALEDEPTQSPLVQPTSEMQGAPAASLSPSIILMPASVMPSKVFILNNREVVSEIPPMQVAADSPSSIEDDAPSRGVVSIRVSVAPLRLIVVDENDNVTEIWSNTTGSKRDYYLLRVMECSAQGADHPITQEIVAQYNQLGKDINWQEKGQVYNEAALTSNDPVTCSGGTQL